MLNADQLKKAMPYARKDATVIFAPLISECGTLYSINTAQRMAAFLGQAAHESGSLRYLREIASGAAYEGRKDLGNTVKGDGVRYKGRGIFQITGRANYAILSKEIGVDFVASPELLEVPDYAALSAAWYWNSRNLNYFADRDDYKTITKKINGGYNGYTDRCANWIHARAALGLASPIIQPLKTL